MKNSITLLAFTILIIMASCTKSKLYKCCEDANYDEIWSNNSVYIPNAFSPNGDGVNDIFRVQIDTGLALNKFIIKKGNNILYQASTTNQFTAYWDGTNMNNGNEMGEAVYNYEIELINSAGNIKAYNGKVALYKTTQASNTCKFEWDSEPLMLF